MQYLDKWLLNDWFFAGVIDRTELKPDAKLSWYAKSIYQISPFWAVAIRLFLLSLLLWLCWGQRIFFFIGFLIAVGIFLLVIVKATNAKKQNILWLNKLTINNKNHLEVFLGIVSLCFVAVIAIIYYGYFHQGDKIGGSLGIVLYTIILSYFIVRDIWLIIFLHRNGTIRFSSKNITN
jgi:hypothetical protein